MRTPQRPAAEFVASAVTTAPYRYQARVLGPGSWGMPARTWGSPAWSRQGQD
ncbi:MAG TPA: hypothetical protein VNF47_26910 [Streptosporangiaceae bacterium]|nr:hypothetical protein [Streptosporangiaceae bacterium]